MEKKDFILSSKRIVAAVDFVKWTSSFGEGALRQMETPVPGVRFAPGLSTLFGFAEDETGLMLTMHAKEGPWLANLPIECAFIGYGDELLIVTEQFSLLDVPFEHLGLAVFIPSPSLRERLANQLLLGFGLAHDNNGLLHVERTNKIVPLYTPDRYEAMRAEIRPQTESLFRHT